MIIGLTGTIASGKGIVGDYFKEKGFIYLSLSNELRQIAKEKKVELTRENLQNLGNELREKFGASILAKIVSNIIKSQEYTKVVVDGIRNPAEVKELEKLKDFFLIAVDAPREVRFKRVTSRNRESDPKTFEGFLKIDKKDRGIGEKISGQGVGKCMKMAKFILINDKTLEETQKKIDKLYADILMKIPPISWDEYFMSFALTAAKKSKDPSTKVGACIVDSRNRVVGLGFNGFPRNCCDNNFPFNRDGDFLNTKYPYIVHAEPNAILNSIIDVYGCKMYVTLFPCNECAKIIIQAGIKEVIYACDKYANTDPVRAAKKLFKEAKVKIRFLQIN